MHALTRRTPYASVSLIISDLEMTEMRRCKKTKNYSFIMQEILIFAFFTESTLQESKTSAVDQEKMIKETKMSMMQVTGELY